MKRVLKTFIALLSLMLITTAAMAEETRKKDLQPILKNQKAAIFWPQTEHQRPQVNWYWKRIKSIASKEFKGSNYQLTVGTGYKIGGDDKGISISASIPVYVSRESIISSQSKKDKLAQRKLALAFLDTGAKLCAQLERALARYLILQQAYTNYELLAQDEGAAIIEKLVDTQIKIVETEAEITQSHRQLQSLISPFSSAIKILSWDKGQ